MMMKKKKRKNKNKKKRIRTGRITAITTKTTIKTITSTTK